MDDKYTVKMTHRSYIVYNWVHNLPRKLFKVGVNGMKVGNLNQPYNKHGEKIYNLPVPGLDVSEYELWLHISYYEGAIVCLQTGYDPITVTKYKTRMAYSYDDKVTVQAVKDPQFFKTKHVSAIYLVDPETGDLLTYWTRIGGADPYMSQSTVIITTHKHPWLIESQDSDGLIDIFKEMQNNVTDMFNSLRDPSRLPPTKPGIYIAKNGLALCMLPNTNWILDTAKFSSQELTWSQVKECMPKEQFPLEYRGRVLWN